ncbi:MAG: hypothetical protein ABIU87_09005 [Ornithinibacter sp.]
MLTGLLTAKAAAALGGAVVALGATAMVVTLSLPHNGADRPPVSPAARTLAATPAPTETDDGEGVGPDATGPAAHGLCTAWSRHQANGSAEALNSVAMRNLAKAAGGANRVEAYCATIKHPGKGSSRDAKNRDDKDKGKSATAPHGQRPKPSANSRSKPSTPASPTGKPTPQTSPSTSPTPSPTGSAT